LTETDENFCLLGDYADEGHMKRQPLARHLLESNLALTRENSAFIDYLVSIEATIHSIQSHAKATGIVELDRLSELRRQLQSVITATEDRRIANTGRKDAPDLADLNKTVQQDEGIKSYLYNIDIDPVKYDKMLGKMLDDMFKPPTNKEPPPPPPPQTYDGAVYFFKSINWGKNFGGDLEGEWQDYQDEENPEDPLDER
jgi:hypothetical protein